MTKLTLQELESDLWQCVDILSGELTGVEYKNYIFGMLFLKRINDEFDEERKGKILLIDGNKNKLREEDIEKIVAAFEYVEKYATVVDIEIIKENDFNLNISRYVDATEEEEQVDIQKVLCKIVELEKKEVKTKEKLNAYLKELGFGVL